MMFHCTQKNNTKKKSYGSPQFGGFPYFMYMPYISPVSWLSETEMKKELYI